MQGSIGTLSLSSLLFVTWVWTLKHWLLLSRNYAGSHPHQRPSSPATSHKFPKQRNNSFLLLLKVAKHIYMFLNHFPICVAYLDIVIDGFWCLECWSIRSLVFSPSALFCCFADCMFSWFCQDNRMTHMYIFVPQIQDLLEWRWGSIVTFVFRQENICLIWKKMGNENSIFNIVYFKYVWIKLGIQGVLSYCFIFCYVIL